nr:E3 ubiquitin-protein ligase RNF181 isoform X2 [Marmota flaviventris]
MWPQAWKNERRSHTLWKQGSLCMGYLTAAQTQNILIGWLLPSRHFIGQRLGAAIQRVRGLCQTAAAMASYFDEHDCEPLDREQDARTNMLLELARSLFNRMDLEDLGLVVDWDHHLPPPAAKAVVESLPRTVISGSQAALPPQELKCPVCLLEFEEQETVIEMPCHHLFHSNCILPWLSKTNSCPLCRHELPTDDDTYEEHRRDKARKQQQQHRLENLHGAMYT